MKRLFTFLAMSGLFLSASAATTKPKVVFIGDYTTYLWTDAFIENSNWINKGVDGQGFGMGEQSAQTAARFQTDVVALHPDIVHIMVGANDAIDSGVSFADVAPVLVRNLDSMVQQAKAANIQVILGIDPEYYGPGTTLVNNVIEQYGAAKQIPFVNYDDGLTGCATERGASNCLGYTAYFGFSSDAEESSYLGVPSAAGFALMTQMAETALASTNLTLKAGWLQNLQFPDPNLGLSPPGAKNVNSVLTSAVVHFLPVGKNGDGSDFVLSDVDAQGSKNKYGTWSSSNPLVMSIDPLGIALALTPGTTIIRFTPYNGVRFNEWIMYVRPGIKVSVQRAPSIFERAGLGVVLEVSTYF